MKSLVAAVLSLAAVSVLADTDSSSGFYVGGNVVEVEANRNLGNWTAIEAVGGYKLNPYVGGEVRLGAAGEGSPNLDAYSAAYYRVESANDVAKAYLLVGYAVTSFSGDDDNSSDYQGLSYGGGAGFVINRRINFNVELRQLVKDNDDDIDLMAISAGVDYRF